MRTGNTLGLSGLGFVNPHESTADAAAWTYAAVPATRPTTLPTAPRPLDVEIPGQGRSRPLSEWIAETYSTSLLVVDRGVVVYEWYADGLGPTDLFLGASMTKSALAHLVGRAVAAGAMALGDRAVEHVPELADSGYAECTVEHLLTMTTGVDWVEDHRDPASLASRLLGCFAAGSGDSRELLRSVRPKHRPGTRFEYCTADSQVLDWVRERATRTPYAAATGELWRSLGCRTDAVVALDGPDGVALAGGGLAATARDWARIAMLQIEGTVEGEKVLDPDWIERSSAPSRSFLAPGRLPSSITTHAGFGYHWWPLDDAGRRVTADGSRGQFAYADRDLRVVVVKTSHWPYDDWLVDRGHRDLSYLGLPLMAQAAVDARSLDTGQGEHEQEA
jgi:CubicO group peptidase (beta-lactamase class C family)